MSFNKFNPEDYSTLNDWLAAEIKASDVSNAEAVRCLGISRKTLETLLRSEKWELPELGLVFANITSVGAGREQIEKIAKCFKIDPNRLLKLEGFEEN